MKITKIGHCCLIIETKGKKIVTDPGSYTIEANAKIENIDYILFTHEHQDHYHLESLKEMMTKSPQAVVYCNDSVAALLKTANVPHTQINHNDTISLGEIKVTGIGEKHAILHSSIPVTSNIGFLIDDKLWYPGDNFTNPELEIEVLALPAVAPWLKLSEVIDYAIALKPKIIFPVHDSGAHSFMHLMLEKILSSHDLEFVPMSENDVKEF
ncbi:MAG: putative Zn-dependent hydrolase [Candidatus Doudnabacteria bacterium]|nr:putative Zn-dependent hydrolase [Candidatus Doudnabacteria bacterium]